MRADYKKSYVDSIRPNFIFNHLPPSRHVLICLSSIVCVCVYAVVTVLITTTVPCTRFGDSLVSVSVWREDSYCICESCSHRAFSCSGRERVGVIGGGCMLYMAVITAEVYIVRQVSRFIRWCQCVGYLSFLIYGTAPQNAGRRYHTHSLLCCNAGPITTAPPERHGGMME